MTGRRQIGLDDSVSYRTRQHAATRVAPTVRRSVQPSTKPIDITVPVPVYAVKELPKQHPVQTTQAPPRHTASNPALPRQTRSMVLSRQMVQKKPKKRIPHITHKSRVSVLLVMMAGLIFIGGSMASYLGWKAGKNADAHAQQEVLAANTDPIESPTNDKAPSEEQITSEVISGYHVAAELPRVIRIPRLQVEARVKRMVISSTNELGAPNNISDVGWYDASNPPGAEGVSLLTGYVSGPTKSGVFQRLGSLKEGDTIEIEQGDGTQLTYKVAVLEVVDHDKFDIAKALTPIETDKPGLTLVTFSERYDIKTNKYEQRNVVYAVQQ